MREYLQPIGNSGFYQSPTEPVDPRDCERWPNSPYCSSISADRLGAARDIATRDYTNLPSNIDIPGIDVGQFATDLWRGVDTWGPQNIASVGPSASDDGCEVCVHLEPSLFYISLPPYSLCYRRPSCRDREQPRPERPENALPDDLWTPNTTGAGHGQCWYRVSYAAATRQANWEEYGQRTVTFPYRISDETVVHGPVLGLLIRFTPDLKFRPILCTGPNRYYPNGYQLPLFESFQRTQVSPGEVAFGVLPYYTYPMPYLVGCERYTGPPFFGPGRIRVTDFTCSERPYIEPPPQPSRDPMPCCNTQEIEELLRLIAARLGVESYPASVPQSLIQDQPGDAIELQSLTELMGWFIQQTDALVGQFPVDIKIQDSDPTQEGDQTVELKLPNIAEAIAEIYALAVKSSTNSDIHTSFLMRLAAEVIATKNSSIIIQDYVRANAAFLGYKGNPKKRKIKYAFDPEGLSSLETILRESEKFVQGWQEDDPESVVNYLQKIVFSAGIIKASLFRNPRQYEQLLGEIGGLFNRASGDESDGSWEAFLEALNNPESRFNQNAPRPQVLDPNVET